MTKSFLLHWYIANGDETNYRKNALDYFNGKSDLEEKELKLCIKELELKQELYEDAKKRAEAAGEVSEVDDGFLAALGATAVNDWAQD